MKKRAFTLVEILVVVAILGLIAAVGVPAFLNSRLAAGENIKKMNIQSVQAAKEQWAIINNKAPTASVTWDDIEEYVGGGVSSLSDLDVDGCSITLNKVGEKATY